MTRLAGPPYRTAAQWHGPCVVLDPEAWAYGHREILTVLPAIPPRPRRQRTYVALSRRVATQETRSVVSWPKGRPWETYTRLVPVLQQEPGWHARARELRGRGLSVRSIMRELRIDSYGTVYRALFGS